MFTGIIKNIGIIKEIDLSKNYTIKINSNFEKKIVLGESISCSGICLTVKKVLKKSFWVNVSEETIKKTSLKHLRLGSEINLEKSLKVGDEIGGHLVFGHIDGVSTLKKLEKFEGAFILTIKLKKNLIKYMTPKCSITLDGISLTVNEVKKNMIKISIIPFTWDNTSLKNIKVGDFLNTEVDMIARYTFKAVEGKI
tara:strand:+ start:297 stop:884 length:588 start_codon:yes stop_codon:yes gene_type:complete